LARKSGPETRPTALAKQLLTTDSWIGSGALPVAWGLRRARGRTSDYYQQWFQFSADHPSIVQFAFADASVKQVQETIPVRELLRASAIRDNEKIADPELLGF